MDTRDEAISTTAPSLPKGHLWRFLFSMQSELPISMQTGTPLPFLHPRHVAKFCGKDRLKDEICPAFNQLALFAKAITGLKDVCVPPVPPVMSMKDPTHVKAFKPRELINAPKFLYTLYQVATQVAMENKGTLVHEPSLTESMAKILQGDMHKAEPPILAQGASKCEARVWHQTPPSLESRRTPDFLLKDVLEDEPCCNSQAETNIVVVEAKREKGNAFFASCNFDTHLDQVCRQMFSAKATQIVFIVAHGIQGRLGG